MNRLRLLLFPASLLSLMIASAPSQAELTEAQLLVVDSVSEVILQQLERTSCQDFFAFLEQREQRQYQNPQIRERFTQMAQNNPEIREEFVGRIAAPIVNKMFECQLVL